jgi:radical SAM superfamily enzyme YgiQ (UPF0313 family)
MKQGPDKKEPFGRRVCPARTLKIVLVQPPKHQDVESLFTFHKHSSVGHRPPMGIITLATHLISQGFKNTRCLDAIVEGLSADQAARRLAELRPDVVGFSTWTDFWYPAWKTIRETRAQLPNCKIIVGGPHCLVYPRETLEYSQADFVVAGDGEDTLLGLLDNLASGLPVEDLPGLWRKEGGQITPPKIPIAIVDDLDKIPNPDRMILPFERYNSVLNSRAFEATMVTTRGCPFRCVFCKMHAQKVYARSAQRVVDEFHDIASLGISDIQVYDDTFTWSKKRVIDICNGIIDSGIKVRWAIRDRVNRADPEVYALLRRAGCHRIHFGVESGSPPILKASGKGITLEQAEHALAMAKSMGFTTMAFYLFGFLNETRADALQTIRFATRTESDYATFSVLIPYPGTSLYKTALEQGIIPYDYWLEFTKHPVPNFHIPHLIEQYMDRTTLIKLKNKALRRYYFQPGRVWRELMNLRSRRELRQKTRMAANIVVDSLKTLCNPNWIRPGRNRQEVNYYRLQGGSFG